MKITFSWIGKSKFNEYQQLQRLYTKRLRHYCKFEIREFKELRIKDTAELKVKEGRQILSSLVAQDYLILLDETGRQYSSRQLATELQKLMNRSQNTTFLIGGAFGVSEEVFDRSNLVLSLSKMTLTHDMARLLLLEQVYRAHTIIRGEKYHND